MTSRSMIENEDQATITRDRLGKIDEMIAGRNQRLEAIQGKIAHQLLTGGDTAKFVTERKEVEADLRELAVNREVVSTALDSWEQRSTRRELEAIVHERQDLTQEAGELLEQIRVLFDEIIPVIERVDEIGKRARQLRSQQEAHLRQHLELRPLAAMMPVERIPDVPRLDHLLDDRKRTEQRAKREEFRKHQEAMRPAPAPRESVFHVFRRPRGGTRIVAGPHSVTVGGSDNSFSSDVTNGRV